MSRELFLADINDKDEQKGESNKILRIVLLGSPKLIWRQEALVVPRRQVRALLYRLATDLQSVPREQLSFLFWSDEPQASAKRKLTHLLTHLRLALPDPNILEITHDNVSLDPRRVWSDTTEFDALCKARIGSIQSEPQPHFNLQSHAELIEKAVQLYNGSFLNGFSIASCHEFDTWIIQQRREYECRYLDRLLELLNFYQSQNEYEPAINCARRYLEVDNLAENVHCKLIELYAAIGDRSAVERQFEQCIAALEQELGVSPSPKTWNTYQSVLGHRLPGILHPPHKAEGYSIPKLEIPFTGREELLKQIDQAVNLASMGRGKIIFVRGEAGIGKSRLLQQVASQYHHQTTVMFNSCTPGMVNLPYHPIAEVFRSILEVQSFTLKINPIWLAEAARLLPEIYSRYPDLPEPQPVRPEEARRRLFEALYQLALSQTTSSRPLLMCLDDLHWADTTTLEWLTYTGNRVAMEGFNHILIICTYRDVDSDCLAELRFALNRLGVLEEYLLEGLGTDEVLQILKQLFGPRGENQALATRLHHISGGNPFFLFETLQIFIESRSISSKLVDLDDFIISKTVQEAIHQRLARLNPIARKILEITAVLNKPFTLDLVQMVTENSELEILESLEALTTRHLLAECDGKYQFHHELVQAAIYNELGYDRRRFLHRRCANILEKLHPGEIALLAWHFEKGGEIGKAAGYALQAGVNSSRVFAYNEALEFFSRALNLLKQKAPTLNAPEEITANYRAQLLAFSRRGSVFRSLGDMHSYQNDFEEEAHIAGLLGDKDAMAKVYIRKANAHRWFCRYSQAREWAEKALQISREEGYTLMEAKALREIGLAARAIGDFAQAKEMLQEALKLFVELKVIGYEIHTLCNLSALYAYMGDFRYSLSLAGSALSRCDQAQLHHLRRIPLGDLGVAFAGLGEVERGRECLLDSLEIARQTADRTQEIFCLCHLGWLENHAGRQEEAHGYFRDGLVLAERLDSRSEQSRLYAGVAEAHRLLGNKRLAKGLALKALDLAQKHGQLYDQDLARKILSNIE
jgi:DNA-binding SARP family transcriptional activator